jgi:hypothetical protein
MSQEQETHPSETQGAQKSFDEERGIMFHEQKMHPSKRKGLKRPLMKKTSIPSHIRFRAFTKQNRTKASNKKWLRKPDNQTFIQSKIKQICQLAKSITSVNQTVEDEGNAFWFDDYTLKRFSTTSAVQRGPHQLKGQTPHNLSQLARDAALRLCDIACCPATSLAGFFAN